MALDSGYLALRNNPTGRRMEQGGSLSFPKPKFSPQSTRALCLGLDRPNPSPPDGCKETVSVLTLGFLTLQGCGDKAKLLKVKDYYEEQTADVGKEAAVTLIVLCWLIWKMGRGSTSKRRLKMASGVAVGSGQKGASDSEDPHWARREAV